MGFAWLKEKWSSYPRSQLPPLLRMKKEASKIQAQQKALSVDMRVLPVRDQNLIADINQCTREKNLNNITRTMAYLAFYRQHPEIHWAFLGHMVSRNGGWNMTDLKGELVSRLLSQKEQEDFFSFLERGNWIIFQDVYPQFLLYEESVRRQTNLFYLLPYFHVSCFMQVLWDDFWQYGDCERLAFGLVINEQSYLELHVLQKPHYQETVLQTLEFKLQDLLRLNQILFPLFQKEITGPGSSPKLIGQTLHHFASLHERISLGKRLYSLLFHDSSVLEAVTKWATKQPHTGSRKDYWPHVFNTVNESVPGARYKRKIGHCQLLSGSHRLYSPVLAQAWPAVNHDAPAHEDWYRDWKMMHYLLHQDEKVDGDVANAYCKTLEKIELAIIAHEKVFTT